MKRRARQCYSKNTIKQAVQVITVSTSNLVSTLLLFDAFVFSKASQLDSAGRYTDVTTSSSRERVAGLVQNSNHDRNGFDNPAEAKKKFDRLGNENRTSVGSYDIEQRIHHRSVQQIGITIKRRRHENSEPQQGGSAIGSSFQGKTIEEVPMSGGFDLEFVERHGKNLGYMSNTGPVKVWESPMWPLKKQAKWQQPQKVCPGRPIRRSLHDGAPSRKFLSYVKDTARMMAEGKYQLLVGNNTVRVLENRCMFLTKDCSSLDLNYGGPQAMKALKLSPDDFNKLRNSGKFVDLKPRMLGSCAMVANSENLLRGGRGADIDEHDTIFRHNTPLKGYEKAVGRRKTSVMWVKDKYTRQRSKGSSGAELMYDLLLGVDKLPKSFSFGGKPLMILNKMGGYSAMVRERFKWYKMAGGGSRNHPSGGFARPFALLASGLCTRVDLYGFSARPSGKYFNKNAKVLRTHLIKFEHWVYRYLMSVGKLCVYGD